jgi:hypothetical protein
MGGVLDAKGKGRGDERASERESERERERARERASERESEREKTAEGGYEMGHAEGVRKCQPKGRGHAIPERARNPREGTEWQRASKAKQTCSRTKNCKASHQKFQM